LQRQEETSTEPGFLQYMLTHKPDNNLQLIKGSGL